MRRFFKWAVDPEGGNLLKANPMLGIKLRKGKNSDGFHTWTDKEITRFEKRRAIGTGQRLALDLLLYTGLARGDVVRLGKQHVSNGVITFRMEKNRGDGVVYPPMLPVLAKTIAASKTGDLTFLVTERGMPFVKESFGNWFRDACRAGWLPGLSTRAPQGGSDSRGQRMARPCISSWRCSDGRPKKWRYTQKADRKRLASAAAPLLLLPTQMQNENHPHLESGAGVSEN
jgi:integrase